MTQFLIQFFILSPLFVLGVIALSALVVGLFAVNTQMNEEIKESRDKKWTQSFLKKILIA